ncbi:hypothetical protein CFC21_107168 [Triticum aestivum]|uniref:O-methyltransferase domain-containing protein n=2 Tax=Triticum aestivum TaxID=4565 RepID=A0A3B6TJY8_WHEAT|nr:hypothetical protein CFC21_107168 [Triticum aestivum]
MAAQAETIEVPSDAELLQAQADLWRHSLYYLTSMALRCAVEHEIPTAIHRLGGLASLPDLMTALSLPSVKMPFLGRVMRVLVNSGVFATDNDSESGVELYRLTPLSRVLVHGVVADEHHSQKYFVLGVTSPHYTEAALGLADWFKKDTEPPVQSPFEEKFGVPLFDEKTALLDEELDAVVNKGLATSSRGLSLSLTAAVAMVIDKAPTDGVINYVAGDLFHTVPPSQAVMLKLVLHFWSDEDCVKILAQCRKAIPPREEGGKVIIIEIVVAPSLGPVMFEAQLLMDMLMMVNTRGGQRDEKHWSELFKKAGFTDYKIVKKLGARSVIEVYP